MFITKKSIKIIKYFSKYFDCISSTKLTKKTKNIFEKLYFEIKDGVEYINNLKKELKDRFYNLEISQINSINEIPKPKTFSSNAFPGEVRDYIDKSMSYYLTYNLNIFERNITIIFILENENINELTIKKYNDYIFWMLVWLYIINDYSNSKCSSKLTIYLYQTSLLKLFPNSNLITINHNNVNTAFTRICQIEGEIVVFRKEEWFKVFMHETFHNFGLDFSNMNTNNLDNKILNLFPLNIDVRLYESYTEFWARIMNTLFCSYNYIKNKENISDFLNYTSFFIDIEIKYSYFQVQKILNFMGLDYKTLYEKTDYSQNIRNNLYKEDSPVLSYYMITLILLTNYQDFLLWCDTNNTSLLQFKKTIKNQNNLYKFIENKYKSKKLLNGIKCATEFINKLKNKSNIYLLRNLRMTLCELE